jgi:hypothetical protein
VGTHNREAVAFNRLKSRNSFLVHFSFSSSYWVVARNLLRETHMKDTELPAAIELSDDIVWGAPQIAAVIGRDVRATLHLLTIGRLPAKKIGGRWCSKRSALAAHFIMPAPSASKVA